MAYSFDDGAIWRLTNQMAVPYPDRFDKYLISLAPLTNYLTGSEAPPGSQIRHAFGRNRFSHLLKRDKAWEISNQYNY